MSDTAAKGVAPSAAVEGETASPDRPTSALTDLITGSGFALFAAVVIFEAWRMDRLESRGVEAYTAPGLVPGVVALLLGLASMVLIGRSIVRWRAARAAGQPTPDLAQPTGYGGGGLRRLLVAGGLIVVYGGVLVAAMPAVSFGVATALFVFTFVMIFDWPFRAGRRGVMGLLATAAIEAVVVAGSVVWIFEKVFYVRLP